MFFPFLRHDRLLCIFIVLNKQKKSKDNNRPVIIFLSPSKTMGRVPSRTDVPSKPPPFIEDARELYGRIQKLPPKWWSSFGGLSPVKAQETWEIYQAPFSPQAPAGLLYTGTTYQGLAPELWSKDTVQRAKEQLYIFSALFGILPFDGGLQPYRLDFKMPSGKMDLPPLMSYWKHKVQALLQESVENKGAVNCASGEFLPLIKGWKGLITPEFREWRQDKAGRGRWQNVSTFSKKARGSLASWCLREGISRTEDIRGFDVDGYAHNTQDFSAQDWVFTRMAP
jgi:cytoplasmic iron level regulating protein YaaA (DUF328/UPF0246 family)